MKIEMRGSGRLLSPSSGGGTALTTRLTRPSAGATTSPSRHGVTRAGTRKKKGPHAGARGGMAKKMGAPGGRQRPDPAERRPQEEQHQARQRDPADERIALRMD